MKGTFLEILDINKGHFSLESGLHGDVWFDLEEVFIRPAFLMPFIENLSKKLEKYNLSAICGALVGGAFVGYSIAKELGIDFYYTEKAARTTSDGSVDVSYRLPKSIRYAVANKKVGIVDDVINAGSAVTKTYDELRAWNANPVVMACILTVGGLYPKILSEEYPQIESLEHLESNLWHPNACPLCKSGVPLRDPYAIS
jgi:orotate phosphoribosyltransferase